MASTKPAGFEGLEEDPIYRNSLREARFILGLWTFCFIYTVSYCYLTGYLVHEPLPTSTGPGVATLLGPLEALNRDAESLTYPFGLGIPDWVFYGVAVPWGICIILSFVYGLFIFTEDDLSAGSLEEKEAAAGDSAAQEESV